MKALATVNEAIIQAYRVKHQDGLQRRHSALIRAVDDVMSDLEEFHLAGRERLPLAYEARLGDVAALIAAADPEAPSQMTITRLTAILYDIQEALLAEKTAALFGDAYLSYRDATG